MKYNQPKRIKTKRQKTNYHLQLSIPIRATSPILIGRRRAARLKIQLRRRIAAGQS